MLVYLAVWSCLFSPCGHHGVIMRSFSSKEDIMGMSTEGVEGPE